MIAVGAAAAGPRQLMIPATSRLGTTRQLTADIVAADYALHSAFEALTKFESDGRWSQQSPQNHAQRASMTRMIVSRSNTLSQLQQRLAALTLR